MPDGRVRCRPLRLQEGIKIQMRTERLTIRPITESDWKSIRNIWIDFNKSEYVIYDNEKNTDSDDVKYRIARWADATRKGEEHLFFVSCLEDDVIGFISLNIRNGGYEIGYGFLERFQGKGYAKESLVSVLDYMKEIGAKQIYAGTALKNIPSVRLLKSVGFELVGTEQISFHKDNEGNDIIFEGGNFIKIL